MLLGMELAQQLKAWRKRARLSQEAAARALFVSVSAYQKYEQGQRVPKGSARERIDALLGEGEG